MLHTAKNTMINQLPPLPIIIENGVRKLLIDNSTIELLACPKQYENKVIHKRELDNGGAGRNFGSVCHAGWKERYTRCNNLDPARVPGAIEAINDAMAKQYIETPCPDNDFRTLSHAHLYMSVYNRMYKDEKFWVLQEKDKAPVCEQSFAYPIGSITDKLGEIEIVYTGRIDLIIRDENKDYWILDHKTAFQFGSQFVQDMNMNGGQVGYLWAFKQTFGIYPMGYIINACRVRRPSKRDASIDIAPIDETDFNRIQIWKDPSIVEDWVPNVLAHCQSIIDMHGHGRFPMQRKMCVQKHGACDYYDVCNLMPEHREVTLMGSSFKEHTWSPLNKVD